MSQVPKCLEIYTKFWVKRPYFIVFLLLLISVVSCRIQPSPLDPLVTLTFSVWRDGTTYHADSQTSSSSFAGTLKFVVESAADELATVDGGKIIFQADDFDLGAEWFELDFVTDVIFVGQGIDVTTLHNNTSAATDTEPFDCTGCDRITIRDMTVSAGGPYRASSDALDFDGGDDIIIERVKVTASRGRGIVFDGKGLPGLDTADRNVVRDCIVTGVPSHGIELLASNFNLIENCTIYDVAGAGIVLNKASPNTNQPNKQSNDNIIIGNDVTNAGNDGIRINSSSRNIIKSNVVLNSSDDVTGRDGIRIYTSNSIVCNDNVVDLNTATDNQAVKTQRYGLRILGAACNRTVVGSNDFSGNLFGTIINSGTDTIFNGSSDNQAPTTPTNLSAVAIDPYHVDLSWTASTDDISVVGYEIYRDGIAFANIGNLTTYSDTLTDPATTYTYQVRARDAVANWSELSSSALVTTPSANILTLPAVADTYVQSDTPTTNYGSSSLLTVDGSPVRHILLKFNVFGVGASQVTSATLRLYNTNPSATGGSFYQVNNTSWGETTVTWNTAPLENPTPFASLGAVSSGNWYEVDLGSIVTSDGLVSIKIISTNADAANYTSRQGSTNFRPQLIVETVGP